MPTIIPIHARGLRSDELAGVLAGLPAALPAADVRVVESKGATMLDPATLALFIGAGATAVAGLVGAVATVWAARITAAAQRAERQAVAPAAPPIVVIIVETQRDAVRIAADPAGIAAAVAAAPLPAALEEITAIRLVGGE